jgi:hypothetical protein
MKGSRGGRRWKRRKRGFLVFPLFPFSFRLKILNVGVHYVLADFQPETSSPLPKTLQEKSRSAS